MKKKWTAGFLLVAGIVLMASAEGGAVWETLSLGGFVGLAVIGLLMISAAAWLLKGVEF